MSTSGAGIGIRIHELSKRLGPNQALAGVTTNFTAGELHGVIGPEGAGKTTLLRSLLGLLHPDSGSIQYVEFEKPVSFERVRPSMAYMAQSQSLYADLSVGEHLEFFRELYQIPEELFHTRSQELLHITRLEEFQDRPAGKLSGGMYKKLGLMCALLQSPNIVLLDEPTNGVDPISRREFWELLYRLASRKILIIVTTAYMDEAERCARVHLMNAGKVIRQGEPRRLLDDEKVPSIDSLFLKLAGEGGHDGKTGAS